jgi:DNA-binding transcriptional MocR family regulator
MLLLLLLLLLPRPRLNTVPIPSDQHGIDTEALEQLLAGGSIPKEAHAQRSLSASCMCPGVHV